MPMSSRLCERASGPHGAVAAVCVWPRFARLARERVSRAVKVAAVANFPDGLGRRRLRTERDVATVAQAGADEVDVVLPYRALLAGDTPRASRCCAPRVGAARA